MDTRAQVERAAQFRALHDRRQVLLLPNAWDAGSARVFADLGFAAIATTSGGVAWSLGYADGEQMPLAEVIAAIRRIVRASALPVSADFEAGYGETPAEVGASVRAALEAGVDTIDHGTFLDDEAIRLFKAKGAYLVPTMIAPLKSASFRSAPSKVAPLSEQ